MVKFYINFVGGCPYCGSQSIGDHACDGVKELMAQIVAKYSKTGSVKIESE